MLRPTHGWLQGMNIPTSEELEGQRLINRMRRSRPRFSLRAITASRMQGWVAAGGILVGAALFLGPWLVEEYREMLGYKFRPVDQSAMPRVSPDWWENEWRKGGAVWRAGEAKMNFFTGPFDYVMTITGRNIYDASAFRASSPIRHDSQEPVCALVPLCGDSPIIRILAERGYEVDAVESSETAMRSCVERTENALDTSVFPRIHLHWSDFFSPVLWNKTLRGRKFDVIYERQGMTSLNREQRPDYCYLLKQALKDDGVIYVEGEFRTGRVKGNKVRGPPYSLSRKELEYHFPDSEGYFVRCEETTDAIASLSRENRLLQRVPKSLYVTPFHCVIFREKSVNPEVVRKRITETGSVVV